MGASTDVHGKICPLNIGATSAYGFFWAAKFEDEGRQSKFGGRTAK